MCYRDSIYAHSFEGPSALRLHPHPWDNKS